MELKSTTGFKDIDIDAMLEHTSFDDFMRGLYTNKSTIAKSSEDGPNDFESMMSKILEAGKENKEIKLQFDDAEIVEKGNTLSDSVEAQAMLNVMERRKRRQQSAIFDGSEKKISTKKKSAEKELDADQRIDLTKLQDEAQME